MIHRLDGLAEGGEVAGRRHGSQEYIGPMRKNRFPPGWDEKRVRDVIEYYERQTEDEAIAEDEAAFGPHPPTPSPGPPSTPSPGEGET